MKIKRIAGSTIIVKYNLGFFQGRKPSNLFFSHEYLDALKSALNLIRAGYTGVEVIQFREQIHSYSDLLAASKHLGTNPSDEDILEQVHHSTTKPPNPNLFALLSSFGGSLGTVWAVSTEEAVAV